MCRNISSSCMILCWQTLVLIFIQTIPCVYAGWCDDVNYVDPMQSVVEVDCRFGEGNFITVHLWLHVVRYINYFFVFKEVTWSVFLNETMEIVILTWFFNNPFVIHCITVTNWKWRQGEEALNNDWIIGKINSLETSS